MKLIKGENLTLSQISEVKRAFMYRYTGEHTPSAVILQGSKPTHKTDDEWIKDHAFYIRNDGHLSNLPKYCEPSYYAVETDDEKLSRRLREVAR